MPMPRLTYMPSFNSLAARLDVCTLAWILLGNAELSNNKLLFHAAPYNEFSAFVHLAQEKCNLPTSH